MVILMHAYTKSDLQGKEIHPVMANSNTVIESAVVSLTYPILIFDVDINSFVNEVAHNVVIAFTNCLMQRSILMRERKLCNNVGILVPCYIMTLVITIMCHKATPNKFAVSCPAPTSPKLEDGLSSLFI